MKGLTDHDWLLIARYLKDEATPTDLVQLNTLLKIYPDLKVALEHRHNDVSPSDFSAQDFDGDKAFLKLQEKFTRENLL